MFAAIPLLGACTTVIVPPATLKQPRPVFVLDHGRHSSLVLPHPEGVVRYVYGDWTWYAEVKTGPTEATSAVLWPTRGALGRRVLAGPATEPGVREAVKVGIEHLYTLRAEANDIETLRAELDSIYWANYETLLYNASYDLEFVHHPKPYTAFYNSNHMVAEWLRKLGSEIRGNAFWASWKVKYPE